MVELLLKTMLKFRYIYFTPSILFWGTLPHQFS